MRKVPNGDDIRCLVPKYKVEDDATIMKDLLPERRDRPFPIIIVFHTIVSLCLFFMQYHSKRMDENIQTLLKLKEKLTEQRQKLSSKKKE